MSKGIIVAGFGAIGKTTLGNKYDNIVDMESGWIILGLKTYLMNKEKEKKKGLETRSGRLIIIMLF